ncbi:uncharacterized protein LOC112194189 [Rosa chinensis]|uniref:uncharacterized protein LOC112194189 n=1 Tax=Rosa chinensis TaxID=74649 RepID=UPI000D09127F|nr:uncharacterized protein LOC112194189 [Rosa chinensis]
MPFGLKNAGATYQRAMNLIFHDILGKILEVYIDDMVVKSKKRMDHIVDLRKRGIEVPEDKANVVINASPPRMKKELQRMLGKINFLRQFISNSAAVEASIGSVLAQVDEAGVELAIFYLSRTLTDCETRYTPMERLCLTLYFSACKLRHYMLSFTTCIIAQTDLKAVKEQAIADFLDHHPMLDVPAVRDLEVAIETVAWPDLACLPEYTMLYQATLEFRCTNNQYEYEALIIGLEVLLELGVRDIQVRGNSLLVINKLRAKYRCSSYLLAPFLDCTLELLAQFEHVDLDYIPHERNFAANELAQLATGVTLKYGVRELILKVERRTLPSWLARLLGAHQAGPKMQWLIRRHGYYWPNILKDCIAFAKNCQDCQAHGPVQHIPNIAIQPIIKPWPA